MYLDALMKYLKLPYCVALLNAAAFYGAAHQSPQSFTVMTGGSVPRTKKHAGTSLEFVAKNEFSRGIPHELVREFKTQTGYIKVSSPEFTALTLIQHAERIGGLGRALSVLEELICECDFGTNCPDSILKYIPLPCFQRLGYILENLLGEETQGEALHAWLRTRGAALRKTLLSPTGGDKTGAIDKRWKLVVNETLESDLV